LDKTGLSELSGDFLDVLSGVVGSLVRSSKNDVGGVVSLAKKRKEVSSRERKEGKEQRERAERTPVSTIAERPCLVTERKVCPCEAARMAST